MYHLITSFPISLIFLGFIYYTSLQILLELKAIGRSLKQLANVMSSIGCKGDNLKKMSGRDTIDSGSSETASLPIDPNATVSNPAPRKSVQKSERPLELSALHFSSCLLGDRDVDVANFMIACTEYTYVLERLGTFTLVSVREVHSNVRKIALTYEMNPYSYRSMETLLEAEKHAEIHGPEAQLADPSSAMGLLWARRGLQFWVVLYRNVLKVAAEEKTVNIKQLSEAAHSEVLKPFTGWISRSSFSVAVQAMPDWQDMALRLSTDPETLTHDMELWTDAVSSVLARMEILQAEACLEDSRKSL
mmetsp:Transcript_38775/g.91836  ORF Transcript_38775/g.91836 Transcript_38775/m.91836 type:complete len:304 (-) Transcript_38775:31-942(-)